MLNRLRNHTALMGIYSFADVAAYPASVRYVRAVRSAGIHTAVVSSSANCADVLVAAGITDLFEKRIDGVIVAARQLTGKPAPGTYLAAAAALGIVPMDAAVFEDALSGVDAGPAGGLGFVAGVDRVGQADAMRALERRGTPPPAGV